MIALGANGEVRLVRRVRRGAGRAIGESNNSSTRPLVYSNNSSTRLLVYSFTRPLITSIDINQKNWQFDISNQKMMYVISAKYINLQHRQRLRILSMGILG